MNQMRYKINQSAPMDVIFSREQVAGSRRDLVLCTDKLPGFDKNKYYDMYDMMKNYVGSEDPRYMTQLEDGESYNILPTRKLSVPVDINTVKSNGTVHEGDNVVNELHIDLGDRNYLLKGDLAMLSVIAANKWNRPICFTNQSEADKLGLGRYVRSNGLAYRLVPVEDDKIDNDVSLNLVLDKFSYGNASKKNIYYDEENRRRLNIIRLAYAQLAISLSQSGRKDLAMKVLERFDQQFKETSFPYGMTSNRGNQHDAITTQFLSACYLSGDVALAKKVSASLKKDAKEQMEYYKSLGEGNLNDEQLANAAYQVLQGKGNGLSDSQVPFASDIVSSFQILRQADEWEKQTHELKNGKD